MPNSVSRNTNSPIQSPKPEVSDSSGTRPLPPTRSQAPVPSRAGDLPPENAGGTGTKGIQGLANVMRNQVKSPGVFDLIPGRYPDAVNLTTVLAQIPNTAAGKAQIKALIDLLEESTGITPNPALVSAVLSNPTLFSTLLDVTPKQMSAGIDALNLAYDQGLLPPLPEMSRRLPSGFDFGQLHSAPVARPNPELKEIAPGLYQGGVKNLALSDTDAKANIVVAEIFDRLASNAELPPEKRFSIKFNGGSFTRLETFMDALHRDGYQIEASFEHRVANFTDLKTKGANGEILDVPAALLINTGFSKDGKEALLPAVHSELVIHLRHSSNSQGPALNAKIKWYQGISGTGFFPADLDRTPSWCGGSVSDRLTGEDARRAIHIAGLSSDVINASAAAQDLAVGGYGATGVCNDSVALVQHVMTGKTACYPLLMRDQTLYKELNSRIQDGHHFDVGDYRAIKASIDALPSDVSPNDSAKRRAKAGGLVWEPGQEPFQHVVDARKILK